MLNRIILSLLVFPIVLQAQIPTGYYDDASGLLGDSLRFTLRDIIDNHTSVSYSSLWTHFQKTDKKGNGKVWDMYSDIPNDVPPYEYTFVSDQCGNYGTEGDCYNREHSFPKSWFGNSSPMATDMFHLYPTDGYVNGHRSNLAYGEVSTPTWTSQNGSKKGPNTYTGSSGNAFEPLTEYKGDFARTYFYMVTRYMDVAGNWNSPMLSGNDLNAWSLNMLKDWHTNDPVSQKEINRNDSIYTIQGNRNPFIDHPEYVNYIYDPTIGIDEIDKIEFYFYEGTIIFKKQPNPGSVEIYNALGQRVDRYIVRYNERIDLNTMTAGIYFAVYRSTTEAQSIRFAVH